MKTKKHLRILTWHVHGNYLYYLTQIKSCDFFIPFKPESETGYSPLGDGFDWGENVHQVPIEKVKDLDLDLIIFQSSYPSHKIYQEDQYQILSKAQQQLPKIYIEHDTPRPYPVDTKHIVEDPAVLLIHVTHFNDLMWDKNPAVISQVIEHGVKVPSAVVYQGDLKKGVVIVNNLKQRGRRLGLDVFEKVRSQIPLDLIGSGSEELGGLGEVSHHDLPEFLSHYRFLFYPIRYTSLGLSLCESMSIGLPVIGLATTELVTVIKNGYSGFIDTNVEALIPKMKQLLADQTLANKLSLGARETAQTRFSINRFVTDWEKLLQNIFTSSLHTSNINFNQKSFNRNSTEQINL